MVLFGTLGGNSRPHCPRIDNKRNDIRYNLNESGSHYVKFTFTNQVWLRLNENNPGTTVLSDPKTNTFDIGLSANRVCNCSGSLPTGYSFTRSSG